MSSARDFKNWFAGFSDVLGDEPPSKDQWAKVIKRVEQLETQANGLDHSVTIAAKPVEPGVDPNPRGTHTTALWRAQVGKALEDLEGMDGESIRDAMADPRFREDLNVEPSVMAQRIATGSY